MEIVNKLHDGYNEQQAMIFSLLGQLYVERNKINSLEDLDEVDSIASSWVVEDKDQRVFKVDNDLAEKLDEWKGMDEELKGLYEKIKTWKRTRRKQLWKWRRFKETWCHSK